MTMRLTATVAMAIALLGCTPQPTPPPTLRGGESYEIKGCTEKFVPKTVYKIKISKAFELRNPQVVRSTRPAKEVSPGKGEYDEDYASAETPYTWQSDAANKTRLDVDVGLKNRGEAAMIKIILDDPLLVLRADEAKIRGGGPHGRDMLCSVKPSADGKSVRFIVFYYKEHPNDRSTYGKYNIRLTVTDEDTSSGYKLPIYIDPMVKNNG